MTLEYSKNKKRVLFMSGVGLVTGGVTLITVGVIVADKLHPTYIYLIPTLNVGLPALGLAMIASGITTIVLSKISKTKS